MKNAVIVPLGAKGGFVLKRPPVPTGDAAADRDALREEGVKCYRQFISGTARCHRQHRRRPARWCPRDRSCAATVTTPIW